MSSTPHLVIAWSSEPGRLGEVLQLGTGPFVLGRSEGPAGEARVRFGRERPGRREPRPPLAGRGLSRRQLLMERTESGFNVRREGRAALRVSGRASDDANVRVGDTVLVDRELLLVCVGRPRGFFEGGGGAPPFDFGEADAFGIVGESPRAYLLRDAIAFLARREGHVLITGPSGAGKELTARGLHALSARSSGPFASRNAATLPAGLVDAELFGNAANYPNSGMRERRGLVGEADSGTLFLDEIGELAEEVQAHLLRLLDAGEYQRLGDASTRKVDLRLVCATNRDESALKHDLLHRLGLRLVVPGLDERLEDLPLLIRRLISQRALKDPEIRARFLDGNGEVRIDPALVDALLRHAFTGHARELDSLLMAAMAESPPSYIGLGPGVSARLTVEKRAAPPSPDEVRAALAATNGNVSRAWQHLGVSSRDALHRLMKKYAIDRGPARDD